MSEIRSQTVREALAGYDMLDNQITILGTHQPTPRHAQSPARHLSRDSLALVVICGPLSVPSSDQDLTALEPQLKFGQVLPGGGGRRKYSRQSAVSRSGEVHRRAVSVVDADARPVPCWRCRAMREGRSPRRHRWGRTSSLE